MTQHQFRNTGNVYLAGEIIFHDSGYSRKMHFLLLVLSWLVLVSARLCYNYSHAKQIWETQISLHFINRKLNRAPASLRRFPVTKEKCFHEYNHILSVGRSKKRKPATVLSWVAATCWYLRMHRFENWMIK